MNELDVVLETSQAVRNEMLHGHMSDQVLALALQREDVRNCLIGFFMRRVRYRCILLAPRSGWSPRPRNPVKLLTGWEPYKAK